MIGIVGKVAPIPEPNLAKVGVEGSNPFARSILQMPDESFARPCSNSGRQGAATTYDACVKICFMADDKGHISKRIFISYARTDGEALALRIQGLLEERGLGAWMDHSGLDGGEDWWRQAARTIDEIEHLVLVLTPAALASPNVAKEWSYARTRGVQVSPVRGAADLDDSVMPRWMRIAHRYNL